MKIRLKNQNQNVKNNTSEINKLRTQRRNKMAKKEKMISPALFKRYFKYSSPSDMYKALNEAESAEKNKAEVNTIENELTNLMKTLEGRPISDMKKISIQKQHVGNCSTYSLL